MIFPSIPTSKESVVETAVNSKPFFAPLLHPGEDFELVAEKFIRKEIRVEKAKQQLFSWANKTDAWMKDDAEQIKMFEADKVESKIAFVTPTLTIPKQGTLFHAAGENQIDLTKKAVKFFGVTTNSKQAGFILPDGRMLDLSGGISDGLRHLDHRYVARIMPAYVEAIDSDAALNTFLDVTQSIRLQNGPTYAYFHSTVKPTPDQMVQIDSILKGKDEVFLCINGLTAGGVSSDVVAKPTPSKVRDYYNHAYEVVEEENSELFHPADMADGFPTKKTLEWFEDSVVAEKGKPKTVFHGTLSDLSEFDIEKAGGGYFGKAFYFTDSTEDASENYAKTSGGDFQYRIEQRAYELQQRSDAPWIINEWIYHHPEDQLGTVVRLPRIEEVAKERTTRRARTTKAGPKVQRRPIVGHYIDYGTMWDRTGQLFEIMKKVAAAEATTHLGAIIPVYLKMQNPVIFDGENATKFDLNEKGGISTVLAEVLEDYGVEVRFDIEDLEGEWTGQELMDEVTDEVKGASANIGQILAETWKRMGYDGIIQNAGESFRGMAGVAKATHYVVFRPEQAKSIWNLAPTDNHTQLLMHPDTMQDVEPWLHQSLKVVNEKIKGMMPGKQIRATMLANGVKAEELKWDGLDDFLKTDRKIGPDELRNWIAANAVQIVEQEITPTVYQKWSIPGGTDYHEVALTIPYEEVITDPMLLPREPIPGKESELADVQKRLEAFEEERWAAIDKVEQRGESLQVVQLTAEAWDRKEDALLTERDTYMRPVFPPLPPASKRIGPFKEGHYPITNIVGHVRYNTRMIEENGVPKGILFMEEAQSDWHEKARALRTAEIERVVAEKKITKAEASKLVPFEFGYAEPFQKGADEDGYYVVNVRTSEEVYRSPNEKDVNYWLSNHIGVPFGPFSKTWPELLMRRMMAYAVKMGYDYLAWTTGDQQNERYSLASEVDKLKVALQSDETWWISGKKAGVNVIDAGDIADAQLGDYIGKEMAEKVREDVATKKWTREKGETVEQRHKSVEYTGDDLKIGGHGMRVFYDEMAVQYANKYAKKWGAQVQDITIGTPAVRLVGTTGAMNYEPVTAQETVHGLPITQAMKDAIPQGQPLYHPIFHPDFETGEDRAIFSNLVNDAKKYDTIEEFIEDQERLYGEDETVDPARYQAVWDAAHPPVAPVVVPPVGIPAVVREEAEYNYDDKVNLAREVTDPALAARITTGEVTLAELENVPAPKEEADEALREKLRTAQLRIDEALAEFTPEEQYVLTLADELSLLAVTEAKAKRMKAKIASLRGRLKTALKKNTKLAVLISDMAETAKAETGLQEIIADYRVDLANITAADRIEQTKAKAYQARKDALKKYRDQMYAAQDKRRAAAKLKTLVNKLWTKIMRPAGKGVEFLRYAEEIGRIQASVDPQRHRAATIEEREKSRLFFAKHPELAALVPRKTLERIYSVPSQDMTLAQIEEIYEVVKTLRDQGRLFRSLDVTQHQRAKRQTAGNLANIALLGEAQEEVIGAAKGTPLLKKFAFWSWKPDRMARLLDGEAAGHLERGPWREMLQTRPNATDDAKQKAIRERSQPIADRMKALKLTRDPTEVILGRTWVEAPMDIDGFRKTNGKMPKISEVMYWYLGMKNERTALAILHGVKIPKNVVLKGIAQLTPAMLEIADMIGKDFSDNFPRLRKAFIDEFNMDLAREDNYVPMDRLETSYESRKERVGMELAGRQGMVKEFVARGFTKERIDIAPEHQKPIATDLFSVWQGAVELQEGFINEDAMIRDMHSIIESDQVKAAVLQKLGPEGNKWLAKYINDLARGEQYRYQTGVEKFSRIARSNAAVAWLGFNFLSMSKQLTGVIGYLADAGPLHLMSAAAQFAAGQGKSIAKGRPLNNTLVDEVYEKSERLRNRRPTQELDDLRRMDSSLYESLLKKVGKLGMLGLQTIDTATVVIGWKAVYDKTMAKTGDEMLSRQTADEATTRSQPSSRVQDMAEMYRSGEVMKWFTMFTSELNQIWNRLSFDVPMALRNGQVMRAMADLISFAFIGVAIAIASGALHGDDPEEKKKKLILGTFSQMLEALPLIGKVVAASAEGKAYQEGGVNFFPAITYLPRIISLLGKEKTEEEWLKLFTTSLEAVTVATGVPYVGPKRLVQAVGRGDWEALLGWPKEKE
jgi:hypothetical protein